MWGLQQVSFKGKKGGKEIPYTKRLSIHTNQLYLKKFKMRDDRGEGKMKRDKCRRGEDREGDKREKEKER